MSARRKLAGTADGPRTAFANGSSPFAGLAGNAFGLDGALSVDIVRRASLALYGGGALLSLLAIVMAWRFLRALERGR